MTHNALFHLPRTIKAPLTALALALSLSTQAFALEHSNKVEQAITNATYQYNASQLNALADSSTGYNKAYAYYRLAQIDIPNPDKSAVLANLDLALAELKPLNDPEADVLKAAIWGLMMGADPKSASTLYPQLQQTLAEAKEDINAKPRALLIEGINAFYTPPAYGGGTEKARTLLEEALNHYQASSTDAQVVWGEVETYIWLGQVLEQEQQTDKARSAYKQALALDPNCTWASQKLNALNNNSAP